MLFDDVITDHLGQFGRYQKLIFLLVCLLVVPTAWYNLGIVFLAGVPDHRCAVPELDDLDIPEAIIRNLSIPMTSSGEYSQCLMYDVNFTVAGNGTVPVSSAALLGDVDARSVPCAYGWKYSREVYTETIVSQWDLVCDRDVLPATASSIFMAGLMTGSILTGIFSDLCGRRAALVLCLVMNTASSIALAFASNFITFAIIRFILGFAGIGLFTTAFIIVMEMVGPAYRVHVGVAVEYPWAFGYMGYALIAYGLRDWFHLQLATALPSILLLGVLFIIPESPRWLYSKNRPEKAEAVLTKMAAMNRRTLPKPLEVTVKAEKTKYVWDILKTPRMRQRSFIIFFIWLVNSVVYYGLSLSTSAMGGDDFVNFFVAGAVEVPAYLLAQVTLTYLGRRWPLAGVMGIGGLALLATAVVPTHLTMVTVVLAMVGKFCISSSFAIIYVFTAELYPTIVRQTALSASSCFARIGGIIAPYIGLLAKFGGYIPLLIFGIMSLMAAILTFMLPETKGRRLPETMQDGEDLGRNLKDVAPLPEQAVQLTQKIVEPSRV